jgi:hypothetical protein
MIDVVAALQDLADQLTAAGVPSAVDPRAVNPPGARVEPQIRGHQLLAGAQTVRVRVSLVAPDIGVLDELKILDDLYAKSLTVFTPNTGLASVYGQTQLPDRQTPYPALHLYLDVDVAELTQP